MMSDERAAKPWFAIVLIGTILATVVSVHLVALFSITGRTGDIERADYYEHGERFDGELALRAAAGDGGFSVACEPDGSCDVRGTGELATRRGPAVLVMQRADDARLDRRVAMTTQAPGHWTAAAAGESVRQGWWRVRVELDGASGLAWRGRARVGPAQ